MGTLTSAGGTTFTGPFTIVSGGPNAASAKNVSANEQLRVDTGGATKIKGAVSAAAVTVTDTITSALTFSASANTTAAQSAPAFAEASGFAKWVKVAVAGTSGMAIPLVSASF